MCDNERHTFLVAFLIVVLIIWCFLALPIGRSTMRGDLLKEGYRVRDTKIWSSAETSPVTGEARWIVEVWRDGWVRIER